MAPWTLKVGHPLIEVCETSTGLRVKQTRFLATNDVKPEEDETLWQIPLNIQTVRSDGQVMLDNKTVLKEKVARIEIPNVKTSLYKLNAGTTGFCKSLLGVLMIQGDPSRRSCLIPACSSI